MDNGLLHILNTAGDKELEVTFVKVETAKRDGQTYKRKRTRHYVGKLMTPPSDSRVALQNASGQHRIIMLDCITDIKVRE